MPRGNGTGPMGMGPMTGRGMGICNGGSANYGMNRPFARKGLGRGCYGAGMMVNTSMDDKVYYQSREQMLENELKAVRQQLEQYQNKDTE